MSNYCPNIKECRLVTTKEFDISEMQRDNYELSFCKDEGETWRECTRFIINKTLNFCPDFVLPDIEMTLDEVIDKFDEENG